jgi:hypothetical protein
MALVLPRRTILLDGKTDGWNGIPPLIDLSGSSPTFIGETAAAVTRLSVCRDDKSFYWRVDFAGKNPLLNRPQGVDQGIACFLSFLFSPNTHLQLGSVYWKPSNNVHNWNKLFDIVTETSNRQLGAQLLFDRNEASGKFTSVAVNLNVRNDSSMLVGRIGLDQIARFCKDTVGVRVQLHNLNHVDIWTESQDSDIRFVDLSK